MTYYVKIENNLAVKYHKTVVHRFTLGDVEDPDIYIAQPLWTWQQTEKGKWVMDHSAEPPYYQTQIDYNSYGYIVAVFAIFKDDDYTWYCLKYKE